jgi:uncharacterized protein YgbK (DUF1537 family)
VTRARVGFYGDDFTGSVDVLLQFARFGWTGRLFTRVPDRATLSSAAAEVDLIGIAGIARSLPAGQIADEVLPALSALAAAGPGIVQYKACSTADSSPEIGSIGRVLEVGRELFGSAPVPLLFAQPDFGRYTVFGHHFARERGVVYRLDRQPTMAHHPTTPMAESDLAVHLGRQTPLPIKNLPLTEYDDGLCARLQDPRAAAFVLDALHDAHVTLVGRAIAELADARRTAMDGTAAPCVFAIGSGGLSAGLAAAWGAQRVTLPVRGTAVGPVLAVSGSRSPRTRRQAGAAATAGWRVEPLSVDATADQSASVLRSLRDGTSVVLTSDDLPAAEASLDRIAAAAATVVLAACGGGATRRVILCGGDTSSRVTLLLGVDALSLVANPTGNVVLLAARGGDPAVDGLELLLKGGQVGPDDLFETVRAGAV